jgi:hypothetical protein
MVPLASLVVWDQKDLLVCFGRVLRRLLMYNNTDVDFNSR